VGPFGLDPPSGSQAVSLKEIAVPARNSQSLNKLFGRRPELLGAGKVFSRRIRPGAFREDHPKRNPTSSRSGSRHHLSVHQGRGEVDYIDQVGRAYSAKALDGQSLGVFADLKSAADAVSAAALQAQPVDAQVRHSKPRNSADRRTCGVEPSGRGDLTLSAKKSGLLTSAQKMDRK
jgi:hypothetical protein